MFEKEAEKHGVTRGKAFLRSGCPRRSRPTPGASQRSANRPTTPKIYGRNVEKAGKWKRKCLPAIAASGQLQAMHSVGELRRIFVSSKARSRHDR